MSKVILKGFITVPQAVLAAVINELDNHIRLTRLEDGCLIFEVTKNEENPCRFDVYEEFRDQSAFDRHQLRVKSSTWGKVSANVERNYEVTVSCA
ncbi:putative quinol monooxygenase [Vibrio cholerae]|uniref:putative quinol monooxygenase n=1 Tax=Vibrio cholerae TaxID=666 RepID=UPI000BA92338|nr:antibiotic biosynthesis monooxygenase [Vibrio cholerae]EGQ7970964.1 antibiotic biosynthesis monooxygenase [Vibrio cholerae]EJL6691958.1 antibiotic biosynthesis monooxygenase [Vibrio cholerae]ELJ8583354.1 antibiotic biosynthesis monooxygenase [Vibrio cholerae]ELT6289821.1 antibiotic biosynthesis monooxygenase [Vibrio cholerae]ELU8559927.1 antibiotic biosynthesis monooxygenase [Vibrio cholerae]